MSKFDTIGVSEVDLDAKLVLASGFLVETPLTFIALHAEHLAHLGKIF